MVSQSGYGVPRPRETGAQPSPYGYPNAQKRIRMLQSIWLAVKNLFSKDRNIWGDKK